jgi:hypothetical protein
MLCRHIVHIINKASVKYYTFLMLSTLDYMPNSGHAITELHHSSHGEIDRLTHNIVTCRRVRVTIMTGSSSDDWIYWYIGYNFS